MKRFLCALVGHHFNRWSETLSSDPRGNFRVCLRCSKWEFKQDDNWRRGSDD